MPLREVARLEGCTLTFALDDRTRRERKLAIEHAGSEERQRPEYWQELAVWAGRHMSADGVSVRSIPAEYLRGVLERDFALVVVGELHVPISDDGVVLADRGDTYDDRVAAAVSTKPALITPVATRAMAIASIGMQQAITIQWCRGQLWSWYQSVDQFRALEVALSGAPG
ncbi:hypothetical protein F1721_33265 [Saccharopolyspora hirsuta]|uniref:Uncharacterized protein n=1 Tax=Saccharopolyspora hirsuta TaxID=1837 RepID=A0A5M7B9U4_SACHI|nr:hypothetical protein [Saccharopolyspora hirsuta]KAA5825500.1 hypothetical protein F1721_33265 [Saccharopolyspora hirsuta]